jgi:predicted MFS family arabinose efflux permease
VLYALYAALAVVGGATTSIAYAGIVSTWFVRRRGLALGIMASGGGITAMLVPVVLDRVIDAYGWQAAWLACTAIAALPLPFIALLIRGQPPRSALPLRNASPANADGVTLQAAIRSRAFWLLAAAVLLFTSAAAGLIVHLKPLMQDFGLSPFRAAQISGLLGVGLLVGRLCTGYLLDLVVASHLAAGVMLTAAIGFSILALHSPAVAFLGVLCVGLTLGAEGDILAFLAARHFGLRSYAEIFGWLFGIMALGTASGPLIAGLLYDLGGDYRTTLCLFTAHCLLAALCFCFLDPAPGTRSEVASINLNVL